MSTSCLTDDLAIPTAFIWRRNLQTKREIRICGTTCLPVGREEFHLYKVELIWTNTGHTRPNIALDARLLADAGTCGVPSFGRQRTSSQDDKALSQNNMNTRVSVSMKSWKHLLHLFQIIRSFRYSLWYIKSVAHFILSVRHFLWIRVNIII